MQKIGRSMAEEPPTAPPGEVHLRVLDRTVAFLLTDDTQQLDVENERTSGRQVRPS